MVVTLFHKSVYITGILCTVYLSSLWKLMMGEGRRRFGMAGGGGSRWFGMENIDVSRGFGTTGVVGSRWFGMENNDVSRGFGMASEY